MARYIDVKHQPSFGERISRGLASGATTAAQVIPEHYVNRQRGNSLADLAGIQGEQRQSFMGLAPQQQEKFYDKLIKDRASTKKHFEDQLKYVDSRFEKHIQENDLEGIDRDPYKELVKSYIQQGYSAPEAFDLAKAEALRDKPQQQEEEGPGFFDTLKEKFTGKPREKKGYYERQKEELEAGQVFGSKVFEAAVPGGSYLTRKATESGFLPDAQKYAGEALTGKIAGYATPGGWFNLATKFGGGVGAGIGALTKVPIMKPILKLIGQSITAAEVGALDLYGATGEHPSALDVGKSALVYGGLSAALQGLGAYNRFKKNLNFAAQNQPKAPPQLPPPSGPTNPPGPQGGPPPSSPQTQSGSFRHSSTANAPSFPSSLGTTSPSVPNVPPAANISPKTQALKTTMDQAKAAGVDMDKLAAGDPKEAAVVSAILENNVAKVKEANKAVFNPKSAVKERELMQKLLPESPLEAYLEPGVEPTHTPETIAKREAIKAELEPIQQDLYRKLSTATDAQRKLKFDINRAKSPAERDRLHAIEELRNGEISDMQQQLRDVKYQLKHFTPRATPEEIEKQIDKAVDVFKSEAANPTEAGQKKIERALKLDQDYLERADKILKRGELPGETKPDTFIKMKKSYADRYKAILDDVKNELKTLGNAMNKSSVAQREELKKFQGYLNSRLKRLDADVVNQTDKIKATRALQGPSGAFYKQQIKGLRKDVADLQRDFFKHVHMKTPTQIKSYLTAKERIKFLGELEKQVSSNPTIENVMRAAEHAGVDKQQVRTIAEKLKAQLEQAEAYVKQGNELPKDFDPIKDAEQDLDYLLKSRGPKAPPGSGGKPPRQPPPPKGAAPGPQPQPPPGKPPSGPLKDKAKAFLKKAFKGLAGSYVSYYGLKRIYNYGQEIVDENEALKALESRKPSEISRLKTKWRARGYSDPKIKKLIKQAQASRKLKRA